MKSIYYVYEIFNGKVYYFRQDKGKCHEFGDFEHRKEVPLAVARSICRVMNSGLIRRGELPRFGYGRLKN